MSDPYLDAADTYCSIQEHQYACFTQARDEHVQCERCKEWEHLGLSSTCPTCDKWILDRTNELARGERSYD